MKLKKRWLPLIGILLFVFILSKIDILKTLSILKNINISLLLSATAIYIVYLIIRILKWKYLLKKEGIIYSFKELFYLFFIGMYFGVITPGRIGDFLKVAYLKKDGYSIKKSFISVFIDRLSDLFVLFFVAYFSMFVFFRFFEKYIYWLSILIFIVFVIGILFLVKKKLSKRIIEVIFNLFIPKKYKTKFNFSFSEFFKDLESVKKRVLLVIFVITVMSWALLYIYFYFLANSLDIQIPFLYLVACTSISSMFTLIPVSISGIGTRDAILIILFAFIGIGKETAIAFSVMVLFFMILIAFVGMLCWFRKPLSLKRNTSYLNENNKEDPRVK